MSIEEDGNAIHAVTIKGTPLQEGGKAIFTEHMAKRLESKPEILKALLPSFSPGCRRLTPGPGYLEALTQPNVNFITSPITRLSESAVHTEDGTTHEIDALVCATGFQTSAPPPFTLIGATTKAGSLSSPLRTRFGLVHRLRFYTAPEMQQILLQSAKTLGMNLNASGALAIARRSRGTPRVGNRLLKWYFLPVKI